MERVAATQRTNALAAAMVNPTEMFAPSPFSSGQRSPESLYEIGFPNPEDDGC